MRLILLLIFFFLAGHGTGTAEDKSSLKLTDIFDHVYETSPILLEAREQFKATLELYPQAQAGWLPSLNAEASLFATKIDSSNFGAVDGTTTQDYSVNLDQPIWRGGRSFAETARAKAIIQSGYAALKQLEQNVFFDVTSAYMNLYRDQRILLYRQNDEQILNQEYKAAVARQEIGDLTKTDVEQAKARLARSKARRVAAENTLAVSAASFERFIGFPPDKPLSKPSAIFKFEQTIENMVGLAENFSAELKAVTFDKAAAEHNIKSISRELWPQLSAFASYNQQYDPQPGIIDESETQTIGVRARIALYQGGATRSRIREARYNAKAFKHQIADLRRQIKQEVIQNFKTYKAEQLQIINRTEEVRAAQEALKGVKIEARAGQRTVLDILDADADLIEAQIALARAQRNEIIAQFSLARTLGLLYR